MKLKLPVILSLPVAVFSSFDRRTTPTGCDANNCLRAIRATNELPQASLDCVSIQLSALPVAFLISQQSSFLVETLTPPPTTKTITVTVETIAFVHRTAKYGRIIPPYASACTDIAEYSSACSCIGITESTINLVPSASSPRRFSECKVTDLSRPRLPQHMRQPHHRVRG
jgi:hypothetical protein